MLRKLILILAVVVASTAHAEDEFATWLAGFEQEAGMAGISQATLDAVLSDIQLVPQAIERDQSQPEFVQTFAGYLGRHVTPRQILHGKKALKHQRTLLARVEKRYGIPPSLLVAFWGMETQYGTRKGNYPIPAALATLAFDGRRHEFFRRQLLDVLRIVDAGNMPPSSLHGSWAGAMGHMQFMPSTYLNHGVDGDGDGSANIVDSLSDAMYSAGNYLNKIGWRKGEPVAMPVQLPDDFDWEQAQLMNRRPVAEWIHDGVKPLGAKRFPKTRGDVAIVLPQGWRGPAFMVFGNFDVVMQWNRSVFYALTIANLSDRISGRAAWPITLDGTQQAMSFLQMRTLQQQLTQLGFDTGAADGMPGLSTQNAIRQYQKANGLPADGYASKELADHIAHGVAQLDTGQLSQAQQSLETTVTP